MIQRLAADAWQALSRPHRQAMLKAAATVAIGGWMAMTLLDLRYAQQAARHQQGTAFRQLDETRKQLWATQAEIGRYTHPLQLMDRLGTSQVPTLPVVESDQATNEPAAEIILTTNPTDTSTPQP
ncbi:hypothetical protein [Mucisphaera sp.]|uniref:hypothetical protein n=1 Tax=Mucisphaera sp. TaxID=2913024 RepID=UPI003D0E5EDD